ncbi:MAG: oligosaccharide flippase family protein [Melioribacteraceae bacterium]|nr:oligosaccharide flippase family protein [Melioribacteraceae bacterium]
MIEKIKELTKDTFIYGISTIVGRFLGFLLIPFYTNVPSITQSDFGIYSNIYAYLALFTIIFIYGMDAAFMKYTSVAEEDKKKDTFSSPFLFVSLTSLLLSVILFLGKDFFIPLMEITEAYSRIYYYFILILIFDSIALIPFASLRLKRKAVKFTSIKMVNIILNLTLNLVLILNYKMGIEAIFISNLIASVFSAVAVVPEILSNLKFRIDISIIKTMLKFGLPYLPGSLAAMFVQVIDRPIVLAMTDAKTLGIYQANYKLGIFMMLFVSMFHYAWQPFFLNNAKEENAKELFSKILTLFLLAASIIWIVLTLFVSDFASWEIINGKTIIGKKYLSGLYIVPAVLLAYLFHGLYVNFTAGIYIEEKTKYFPLVTGIGAAVNILSNIILIPLIGILGAALATLFSYVAMSAGLFIISQRFYEINYEYGRIAKILLLLIFTCCLYYFLYFNYELTLSIKFLILLGFSSAVIGLRIISKEEIIRLGKTLLHIK